MNNFFIFRTVSPRGSVSNDDIFRDEQKRKRNWFQVCMLCFLEMLSFQKLQL